MRFIDFNHDKCDECLKCLRACPTKAISFHKNEREIINELCIKCGICQNICPQGALKIHSDINEVKVMIESESKVVASLAPSFAAAYNVSDPLKVVTALKRLGFDYVEETGVAAEKVSQAYKKELKGWNKTVAITTCCPSANYIVEKYYPTHIPKMLHIFSPMLAHGKLIKEKYGPDTKVVFIGPCLAKKAEASEYKSIVDAVLTFHELQDWLSYKEWDIEDMPATRMDLQASGHGKSYPLGVLKETVRGTNLDYMKVDGFHQCDDLLKALSNNHLDNMLIELNVCQGSCINGPDYPNRDASYFDRLKDMKEYINRPLYGLGEDYEGPFDFARGFKNKMMTVPMPSHTELVKSLQAIGKYDACDYLNCGACGYSTCMEKAKAAYLGYSDLEMCMPYLRSKAESLQSIIFENTPNLICIMNEALEIIEYNPAFDRLFNYTGTSLKDVPMYVLMKDEMFRKAFADKRSYLGLKERFEQLDKVFFMNLIYIEEDQVLMSIMTDITANEKNKEELVKVKENTIKVCQDVISKQMRVAQEIASLLGETTAETKINLNMLKDIVLSEGGDDIGTT